MKFFSVEKFPPKLGIPDLSGSGYISELPFHISSCNHATQTSSLLDSRHAPITLSIVVYSSVVGTRDSWVVNSCIVLCWTVVNAMECEVRLAGFIRHGRAFLFKNEVRPARALLSSWIHSRLRIVSINDLRTSRCHSVYVLRLEGYTEVQMCDLLSDEKRDCFPWLCTFNKCWQRAPPDTRDLFIHTKESTTLWAICELLCDVCTYK